MSTDALELLTVGRVGVDIYPQQNGPLKDVSTFAKYLGGTATNVAVGAARLGRRTAVLTKVGPDSFGEFVREALVGFGQREGNIMTSCVFAWEERAKESSRFMRQTIDSYVGAW